MRDTCMDTCIFRGNQDTCGIHQEYMQDTCGIHVVHVSLGGLGECIDASSRAAHLSGHPCPSPSPRSRRREVLRLLRRCLRSRPSAPPSAARISRVEIERILMCIISRCIPHVSDMHRECILCVMYLKYKKKIHLYLECILNVS